MSNIDAKTQDCLKATQALIDFLARHEMSFWADRFEQIAKALKIPDADKAVTMQKRIPKDNVVDLCDLITSKDHCESRDEATLLIKLMDEVAQAFAKLRTLIKGHAKTIKSARNKSNHPYPQGGASTRSRTGASAPRRSKSG